MGSGLRRTDNHSFPWLICADPSLIRSVSDGSSRPLPGIQADEAPFGWARTRSMYLYRQQPQPASTFIRWT